MKKIIRRLTAGVLALLLTFAMTVPAYADEPSVDSWSWSTIEKFAAASPQDTYKALTKGGADLRIGDKNYIETAKETGNKWRFAVYDRNGNRKQSLIPGVADLYPIQDGDTVIWALTARDYPTTLPSVPDQEKPQEPGALPGNVLDIQRWTGSNRQEVAANVAKSFFADANTAILVNNVAFAAAISATNISQGETPILYTQANRLLPETRAILQTIHPKQVGWQSLCQPHGTKTAEKPDAKQCTAF